MSSSPIAESPPNLLPALSAPSVDNIDRPLFGSCLPHKRKPCQSTSAVDRLSSRSPSSERSRSHTPAQPQPHLRSDIRLPSLAESVTAPLSLIAQDRHNTQHRTHPATAFGPKLRLPDPLDQRGFSSARPIDKSDRPPAPYYSSSPASGPSLLRKSSPPRLDKLTLPALHNMPTRVDSMPLPSSHRRDYDPRPYDYGYSRRPSPPPIAAISHSPSLSVSSLDRSSVSSPAPRRSPTDHAASDVHSAYRDPYYAHSSSIGRVSSRPYHHDSLRDSGRTHHSGGGYTYPRPHAEHRYSHDSHPYHVPSYSSSAISSYGASRDSGMSSYPLPGQAYHQIGYTDDAATKLSDRMRRRCYNCSTTDTSTWRRSNLSPGKVLCNKCGLFERTHGRSRPEQFPHRRGPLATTTTTSMPSSAMRARSPPPSQAVSTQLPPISAHVSSLVPHQYTHPSIAPLSSVPDTRRPSHSSTLPNINSWVDASASRTSGGSYVPVSPGRLHDLPRARSPPRYGHVDAEAALA